MTSTYPFRGFLYAGTLLALASGGAIWWLGDKPDASPALTLSGPAPVAELGPDERLDVTHDRAVVFQKALWRRPAADDVILDAERREIADAGNGGVKMWQWFLAVRPGPDLRAWLDTNPFALTPASKRPTTEEKISPPEWFPRELEGFAMRQNAEGRLVFWYSAEQNLLYATDSGFGFSDVQRPL